MGTSAWRDSPPAFSLTGIADPSEVTSRTRTLVRAAQDGDSESFGRIFDTFHLPVYRYIAAQLGSVADAEDLAAETFAAAFKNVRRFRWQGVPFEAWLFKIARSKIADHRRQMQRRPIGVLDGSEHHALPNPDDPAAQALWQEEKAQLLAAVRRLSPDQQEVLALRFFADLSVLEVATVMGRSLSAVRQLQFRAVATLRHHMEWLR